MPISSNERQLLIRMEGTLKTKRNRKKILKSCANLATASDDNFYLLRCLLAVSDDKTAIVIFWHFSVIPTIGTTATSDLAASLHCRRWRVCCQWWWGCRRRWQYPQLPFFFSFLSLLRVFVPQRWETHIRFLLERNKHLSKKNTQSVHEK